MTAEVPLGGGVALRPLAEGDALALATAYRENRDHLAPWEPQRTDVFFTEAGQQPDLERMLLEADAGRALPLVIADGPRIVGRLNLSGIVRGAAQSADVGYWMDARYAGRGLMTAAVTAAADIARSELRLHRLQAGTLLHNVASQSVLRRCGFTEIGIAPAYLRIAGRWQDHRLFQRILAG